MSGRLTPTQRAAERAARHRAKQAAAAGPSSRRSAKPYVAGVAVLALLTGGAVALNQSGSTPSGAASTQPSVGPTGTPSPAQAWKDEVGTDLKPLTGVAVELNRAVAAWRAGTMTAEATAAQLDHYLFEMSDAEAALTRRAPLPAVPRALDNYRLATGLYIQAARSARVGTSLSKGPLQTQLQLAFLRLRELGDRFYDQAGLELETVLGAPPEIEGVEIRRGADVPEWRGARLAAGPPLDTEPAPAPLRTYDKSRPEQPYAGWRSAVTAAKVPSDTTVSQLLATGSVAQLTILAHQMTAASDAIHAAADPVGERKTSTRVQLGMLVYAEAARAAEAARLVPTAQKLALNGIARALVAAGDSTWDQRLGPRRTLPA